MPIVNHNRIKDYWLKNIKNGHNDYIIGSVTPHTVDTSIDPKELKEEIMNIIIQADGNVSGNNRIRMGFCKQRKIDRLKMYLDMFKISYEETDWKYQKYDDNRKKEKPIKWIVFTYHSNKDLKKLNFDLTTMSKEKAEFLFNEMSYWDGTRANKSYIQYFSNDKENADVAYNLVLLSGRKPSMFKHKSLWTVNMNLKSNTSKNYSLRNMTRKVETWNDYLYCLSVPSHYFIARDPNNHMFITHNCISSNNKVVGGTSKLLTHFIQEYKPKSILCFSDYNLFNGKGYEEAGFEFVGFTGPDKFYITNTQRMERINRNPYAYRQYKQMVKEGKLFECYGCGSKKYVWYNETDET